MTDLTHIMLVEDEPDIRAVTELALCELGGFKLTVCESGQHALNMVAQAQPQLILLDVMMPVMDGVATFQKLKALPHAKKVPIIFMTARVQVNEIQEYLNLGAIGIIPKPFDPLTISEEITKIWKAHNG